MVEESRRFEGTRIPDPGFAGDTGAASPAVASALASYAADPHRHTETLAVLLDSRVLVPVVALLGEVEVDEAGLAHDKSSDMAACLLTGEDGRTALLAFTGTTALTAWNPEARPVPVGLRQAALAAAQEQAAALLLDVAGPVPMAIEGDDLHALARGHRLARHGDGWAWLAHRAE